MKLKTKKERREQLFTPQGAKNGRVLSLDAPQSLTLQNLTPQGLNPTRAFSVAEAMIALLIGTIVLGFSAPMITKQLKHNNFTSIQTQILNKKIDNVDDKSDANAGKISQIIGTKTPSDYAVFINGLSNKIAKIEQTLANSNIQSLINGKLEQKDYDGDIDELWDSMDEKASVSSVNNLNTSLTNKITTEINKLKEDLKSKFVPSGAVMYFDLAACPSGWTALSSKYPRAANSFIRNQSGSGRDIGNWQQNAAPEIEGTFDGNIDDTDTHKTGAFYRQPDKYVVGANGNGEADGGYIGFKASKSSAVYGRNGAKEVRPDNIVLLACRKN